MSSTGWGVDEPELRQGLTACLHVRRWVDEALADDPRIGQRSQGSGAAASFSRAEQSSSRSEDADLATRLAAGNAAYEAKFGRVFLIRAAGRSRPEILAELERRLRLAPEDEVGIAGTELSRAKWSPTAGRHLAAGRAHRAASWSS